jgi:rod shape-determining protein MreC
MAAQARRPDGTTVLLHAARAVASPVVGTVLGAAQGVESLWSDYLDLVNARNERDALAERVAELQARVARHEELRRENRRLRELLDLKRAGLFEDAIVANVVASLSGGPLRHAVLVDAGTRDGVERGWVVLHRGAVAGRVLDARATRSEVLLILDPDSGVAVRHQDGRFSGVLRGGNRGAARIASLDYVPRDQAVAVGDVVVTSGLDDLYPPGLVVGRVRSLSGASPLTWEIAVEVFVDPSTMEEVLLLPPHREPGRPVAKEPGERP